MENKIKFCGNCGAQLNENIQFCPKCGKPVNKGKTVAGLEVDLEENKIQKNEEEIISTKDKGRKKSTNIMLISICSVLGIVIILFCIGLAFGGNKGADISQALLGRDYMKDFIEDNNFKKVSENYYESPDGGTSVELDENGIPEKVVIGKGNITLFDIKNDDVFSFETTGAKLTTNGYYFQDATEDAVTYRTEFPGGYKEISIFVNGENIESITYSVYLLEDVIGEETSKPLETIRVDEPQESIIGENQIDSTADSGVINSVFPREGETVVAWHSEQAGYYMIPCPQVGEERFILFTCENSNSEASQMYYVNVTDIKPTELNGIVCEGPLYDLLKPGAGATGIVQIVWASLDTMDFPTISMIDGHQFTDTSVIANDYGYSGPIVDFGYYRPITKDTTGNEVDMVTFEGRGSYESQSELLGNDSDWENETTQYWDINEPYYSDIGDTMNEPHIMILDSSTRRLEDSEIYWMTPMQLRIAINEIYARHGRKFNDSYLQDWFDSQLWYQGSVEPEDFDDNVLSQIEKDNIKVLQHRKQVNEQ